MAKELKQDVAQALDIDSPEKTSFAEQLYSECLSFFAALLQNTPDKSGKDAFIEELGRLFLWGEGFRDGKLAIILPYSQDLNSSILRLLSAVGKILIQKVFLVGIFVEDQSLATRAHKLKILIDRASCGVLTESNREHYVHTGRDSESDIGGDHDGTDWDLESNASSISDENVEESINFYVCLLMNLVPSMEQVYTQIESNQYVSPISLGDSNQRVTYDLTHPNFNLSAAIELPRKDEWIYEMQAKFECLITKKVEKQFEVSRALGMNQPLVTGSDIQTASSVPSSGERPPSYDSLSDKFRNFLLTVSERALRYEDSKLLSKALSYIPLDRICAEAKEESNGLTATAHSSSDLEQPRWGYRDCMYRALMRWFKRSFFTWVDNPQCSECATSTVGVGTISPNPDERNHGAARVEVYRCASAGCGKYERFPRYLDVSTLLHTRRGRDEEWTNCFTLLCRALGAKVRFVSNAEDRVWTGIYSEHQKRWIHVDACEEAWDRPMLYSQGWNKKMTYCIAFSIHGATDVTRRYVPNPLKDCLPRTNPPEEVEKVLIEIRRLRRAGLSKAEKLRLIKEDMREEKELQMGVAMHLTEKTIGSFRGTEEQKFRDDRERWTAEWINARGEAGGSSGQGHEGGI